MSSFKRILRVKAVSLVDLPKLTGRLSATSTNFSSCAMSSLLSWGVVRIAFLGGYFLVEK